MRTLPGSIALLAACLLALPAQSVELAVQVVDSAGTPVADAVVTVRPLGRVVASATEPARRTIDQQALAFIPYLEVFRPGDEVVFRKIRADFDTAGVAQSDHQIRRTMEELMAKAREQVAGEA